jgi:hypothetical protein
MMQKSETQNDKDYTRDGMTGKRKTKMLGIRITDVIHVVINITFLCTDVGSNTEKK